MIKILRTAEGSRLENGQWQQGGIRYEMALPHRSMTLKSAETVVRYEGSIEAARGELWVFVGVGGRGGEGLTLENLYGRRLAQVHPEHVKPVCQTGTEAKRLAGLIGSLAESEAAVREGTR